MSAIDFFDKFPRKLSRSPPDRGVRRQTFEVQRPTSEARKGRLEGRLDNLKKQVGFLKLRHDGNIETAARVPPQPVKIRQWRVDACGVAGDGSGEQAVEVAKQFHK